MASSNQGAQRSAEQWYEALRSDGERRTTAEQLLARRHWMRQISDFDERTGQMLPCPLGQVCARIGAQADCEPAGNPQDRLVRIAEHAAGSIQEVLRRPYERLVREHAAVPIGAVRELDSASFFALSRRSGRTIREKLAGRPYLWAVERRWTVDSAENRLVKALCIRLSSLLRVRAGSLAQPEASWLVELQAAVEAWSQSPAAQEIGRWENLPPNNLLLQHRDYRRLWDAWSWIQTLDQDMGRDHERRVAHFTTLVFWSIVSQLARGDGVRLLEQPCYLDYQAFEILPGRSLKTGQASVEGLIIASTSGRAFGLVARLGVDKNEEGYGFVTLSDERSVFFHSRMFPAHVDFGALRVGTPLAFDLLEAADGKLRAAHPTVLRNPGSFRIEMEQGARITLHPPSGARIELEFDQDGPQIRVRVGPKTGTAEPHPRLAAQIAKAALAAAFGARTPLAADRSPASAQGSSDGACVVDLCSLRPRVAREDRQGILPFRLLWQSWHPAGREPVALDLGTAQAVAHGSGAVTTVSILDLLAEKPVHTATALGQAARAFAARLAESFRGDSLTYLVPDACDDFALDTLRRSINATFQAAEPLPRSVASVFAWQSSAQFAKSTLADGDCVLVLDTVGETLSATLLLARKKQELEQRLPESTGIYWERCPCVQSGPRSTSAEVARTVLEKLGCGSAKELARLCGFQGLVDEGSGLSWQDEAGVWYTPPFGPAHANAIKAAQLALPDPWDELAPQLTRELGRLTGRARIFILAVGDIFQGATRRPLPPAGGREVTFLDQAYEPHRGGLVLRRWQEQAGNIPLWRDRLPELSMRIIKNGRYTRLYLVKDGVTIVPKRGQAVPIEIKDTFDLPAGRPDYRFPLLQGPEGSELRYEAFLGSPAFPLRQDLPVALRLSYSYGTDTPYTLVFLPLQKGGDALPPVCAQWRIRADAAELPAHFPTLPAPEAWALFQRYPKRDSLETANLLEWIRVELERTAISLRALRAPRLLGTVSSSWKTDKGGRRFVFVTCEIGSVFCHEADFLDVEDPTEIGLGDVLSLEVEAGNKGVRGRWITLGQDKRAPGGRVLERKLISIAEKMKKGLRFPFLTVWSGGHSLVEPDVPAEFRQLLFSETKTLLALLQLRPAAGAVGARTEVARQLSDEALFLLCCMHQDAPPEAVEALLEAVPAEESSPQGLRRYWRHVARALGACRMQWQRCLLARVLKPLQKESMHFDACGICLRILGVSIWHCGDLLAALAPQDLIAIVDKVSEVLRTSLAHMSSHPMDVDAEALKDHLELVLGLLRTRAAEDRFVRGILAPGKAAATALAQTVERILDFVSEYEIPIQSRICLAVDKPRTLDKTPDLLYALTLYLTGDDGAHAIRVTEVREDEARS